MKLNFPITGILVCRKCEKAFEMALMDSSSRRHACPHCGQVHIFDLDAFEKKAIEENKKLFSQAFEGR